MVGRALKAAEELEKKGISAAVIDMFTVKPLDEALVIEYAKKTGCVVTAENHNKIGGLTSAVSECLSENCPVVMGHVAVEDEYGEVEPVDYLAERFGLTAEHIASGKSSKRRLRKSKSINETDHRAIGGLFCYENGAEFQIARGRGIAYNKFAAVKQSEE